MAGAKFQEAEFASTGDVNDLPEETNYMQPKDFVDYSKYFDEANGEVSPYNLVRNQFEMEGEGFGNYASQSNAEEHKWTREETAQTLANTIEEWKKNNPDKPIYVNDLSMQGGGQSYQGHHYNGREIDIKWQSNDGQVHSGDYDSTQNQQYYDREATIKMIETFYNNAPEGFEVRTILFNDPQVINHFIGVLINSEGRNVVRYWRGHSNHLHLKIDNVVNYPY
jgi:hypothetical protein